MNADLLGRLQPQGPLLIRGTGTLIPAGFPSPAQDYTATSIDLNDILIRDRAATYILRVSGSSMLDAGIADGDEIIVDRSKPATEGSIVVAAVDGEFTLKRFHRAPEGRIWLLPENPNYRPLAVAPESDFTIFGVVTYCLHHV